ncbi:Aspartate aminotransferase, mitochondrial [Sesamum angolense]|uniref:Aspartate aminotransferase n=2 Tax=Sesamum TaxID=4181 RepID=A0AAE2BUD3_9LAMI|nr:Aspartate aminotransferase, mitochondrial [Sesamum angolense]
MAQLLRSGCSGRVLASGAVGAARSMSTAWWRHVEPAPKDPILGVTEAFLADPSPDKVNVGVGAYRDDNGKPVVLECVREAERRIAGNLNMEYLPMGGSVNMVEETLKLAYGENSDLLKDKRVAAVQALSGTGACRLFADFQKRFSPDSQIYIPVPTWAKVALKSSLCNLSMVYCLIFTVIITSGEMLMFLRGPSITIIQSRGLDFASMMDDIKKNSGGRSHNNSRRDAKSIRIFLEDGHLIGCAQSYAKNMGLYGQRVGCLSVVCEDEKQAVAVKSQLQQLARPMYSNPPVHGALIVCTILGDPDLKKLWLKEVKGMADRIIGMRTALRETLEKLGSPLPWEHVTKQIGMFCYSGMTPEQVDRLTKEYHIYMTRNGRISMAGVTTGNVGYLANAIHEVTKSG